MYKSNKKQVLPTSLYEALEKNYYTFFIIRYFSYHILRIYLITTQTLYQYILKETRNSYIFVSTQNQVVHESTLPPLPPPPYISSNTLHREISLTIVVQ